MKSKAKVYLLSKMTPSRIVMRILPHSAKERKKEECDERRIIPHGEDHIRIVVECERHKHEDDRRGSRLEGGRPLGRRGGGGRGTTDNTTKQSMTNLTVHCYEN